MYPLLMSRGCAVLWLAVCLSLAGARPVHALDPHAQITQYMHRVLGTEDGLPMNTATALAQTADGYLWIGTQEGLARYDGVTLTQFNKRNTPCLTDQWILRLRPMPDGSVWVIPLRSAPIVLRAGRFECEPLPPGVPGRLIKAIVPAAGGGTWFAAFGEGLFLVEGGRVVRTYRGAPRDRLASTRIADLIVARDGALWVATDGGGVSRIAQDGAIATFDRAAGLASDSAIALLQARDGAIWVGTSRGVDRIAAGKVEHLHAMPDQAVNALIEDRAGAIWFGTDGGLFRAAGGEISAYSEEQGLSFRVIRALLEDREGNLWAGTLGGGVDRFSEGPFTPVTTQEGLSDDFVWTVYEDAPGRMWIGTERGGLNLLEKGAITVYGRREDLGDDTVRSTYRDRHGTMWVGTRQAGLKRFADGRFIAVPADDARCELDVSAIAEDGAGALWVEARGATSGIGGTGVLCRLDRGRLRVVPPAEGGVEDIMSCMRPGRGGRLLLCGTRGLYVLDRGHVTLYSTDQGLSSNHVTSVYEDADGVLWIGTAQSGLNRLKDGVIRHATTAEGLFDDKMHAIVEDGRGLLWMSSNRGIARVAKRDLDSLFAGGRRSVEPTVFGSDHGMRTAECNGAAQYPAWRASDGTLWFATMKGAVHIDPEHVEMNRFAPPVIVERFTADGVDRGALSDAVLPAGSRALEFTYSAPSLIASSRIRFRYMLEGFDDAWVEAGRRRTAYYTNLPPGHYVFRVIAANSDGLWNEHGASVSFSLDAQVHQTWWFWLGVLLGGLGLILAVHRMRVRALSSRERELQERVEERTRQIAEASHALQASESYSRAIVGNVGEGIITFDGAGRISRWNAAAARIFAYTADDAVGRGADLLGIDRAPDRQPSAPAAVVEHATRKDGAVIPIEIHATSAQLDGEAMTIWLVRDLTAARRAEARVAAMQRELLAASRRAGMAQVATSVLHNVGNALTSVNVSAGLVLRTLRRSKVIGLGKAIGMLQAEPAQLASLLTESESGRHLPAYLARVNDVIQGERELAIEELESMEKGIDHINAIVTAQQSHARVDAVDESIVPSEMVDDAVRFERALCEMAGVIVRVEHADLSPVRVDRHRLLEIVMNLLVNAREALQESDPDRERAISVRTFAPERGLFSVEVRDSGVGIAPENLVKIFHQGFTTKPEGHGFGLHSSSCAAIELGGGLTVASDGPGDGACFTLTLPIDPPARAARA
jgi:PAS domain S-box-containing protein